jgi:hypothetical protein
MRADGRGLRVGGLSAVMALATACSRPAVPVHDAGAARGLAEGIAEPQPTGATAPPPNGAEQTDSTDGSDPGRDPHRMRRVLGWVSLTIGAEAAVIAVATSLLIEHQKSIRDDNCNAQKVCNTAGFDAVGTIDTIIPWNTGSWFVAGVGLGAGAILLVISQPKSEPQTAITLSPGSSGLGLGVRSSF